MSKRDEAALPRSLRPIIARLRQLALGYPETHEDHPWGHSAFKVNGKVFLFLGADADGLGLSVKLPTSRYEALALPFCEPTHYGLGKHGWVSASFPPDQVPPVELLASWIDESFRAIAPKKVLAQLDAPAAAPAARPKTKAKTGKAKAAPRKPK